MGQQDPTATITVEEIKKIITDLLDEEVHASVGDHFGSPSAHLEGVDEFKFKLEQRLAELTGKTLVVCKPKMTKEQLQQEYANWPCKVKLDTNDFDDAEFQEYLKEHGITTEVTTSAQQNLGIARVIYSGKRKDLVTMITEMWDDMSLLDQIQDTDYDRR